MHTMIHVTLPVVSGAKPIQTPEGTVKLDSHAYSFFSPVMLTFDL